MEPLEIKLSDISIHVFRTETTYAERVFIEDETHPEGGEEQAIIKRHKYPMVRMSFSATVDIDLEIGKAYYDLINTFVAIEKNKIQLKTDVVNTFMLPNKIYLISNTENETIRKEINDILLKFQNHRLCVGETSNALYSLFNDLTNAHTQRLKSIS